MHVTGIIAEYNPLHSGHISQLQKARESGADYIIVAMSGDFVQRGEPAVFDMAARARWALMAGADLVLEIPVIFSTASAPDFAAAGTALLDKLNVVDTLLFGSECGDISILTSAAKILLDEPDIFKETLKGSLRKGDPYPKAQAAALRSALKENGSIKEGSYPEDLFSSPNNILGIEYIRSLMLRQSRIKPVTCKRVGQAYNDCSPAYLEGSDSINTDDLLPEDRMGHGHPSASAIRQSLREGAFDHSSYLAAIMPAGSNLSQFSCNTPIFADDMSELLNEDILSICSGLSRDDAMERLCSFSDLSPELASGLLREELNFASFGERIDQLKSRAYSHARISRALLHLILDITEEDVRKAKQNDLILYARVLGFKKSAEELLGAIHKSSDLCLMTKTAGAAKGLSADGRSCFSKDLYASHLYQSLVYSKYGVRLPNEYNRPLIVI